MGREIALAIARWPALVDHPVRPVVTAVCDIDPRTLSWFDQLGTVTAKVVDYRELLTLSDVDVVYVASPAQPSRAHLHRHGRVRQGSLGESHSAWT